MGLGYAGQQLVYCKSEVTHSILKPTSTGGGLSGSLQISSSLLPPPPGTADRERSPGMDADTLIYTLNFLHCKLAPLLSCRGGPGALAPPSPDLGVLSASFQPDTAVPSAPSGDRLTSHRAVGGKARDPGPSHAAPSPAEGHEQQVPSVLSEQAVPLPAEACGPPISHYGNSLPQEVNQLKI